MTRLTYRSPIDLLTALQMKTNSAPPERIFTYPYTTALTETEIAQGEKFSIARTLMDRITRIRKEITDTIERASDEIQKELRSASFLSYMLDLVDRHNDLTTWIEKNAKQTILCFGNDATDLDAYGAGCYVLSADDDKGIVHYGRLDQEYMEYQCKSKLSCFDDPTMWDHCAEIDGSDRFYIAFETKEDADQFLTISQATLWKDATPEQLKRNHLVRNGYSQEEVEEYFEKGIAQ
jgi:hypothetical protein